MGPSKALVCNSPMFVRPGFVQAFPRGCPTFGWVKDWLVMVTTMKLANLSQRTSACVY